MKLFLVVVFATILAACATGPVTAWNKPGVDHDTFSTDMQFCRNTGEIAGESVTGSGVGKGIKEASSRMNARYDCFIKKGYTQIEITPEEHKVFKSIKTKEERTMFLHKMATKQI